MKEFLKSIGSFVLGIILLAAIMTLVGLFLYGTAWLSDKVLPVVSLIGAVTLLILLLVFLPLSIFKKCRAWCASAFIYWSYLSGLSLWMYSLLVTLNLWGFVAAIIGLIMMGFGIVPVALLACLFKGEWSILFQLILQLALLIGCRLFGFYLAHKAEQEELWDTREKRDLSRQFMKPWLRWILVLPAAIGAWIGIQFGIILVSGIIDIAWFGGLGGANDTHLVQFLNTIASAWAFVFAGAKTAPSNRGATALCLTALFMLGSFGAIFLAQGIESGKEFWGTEWSSICGVASALTMLIMCYEICKEEKQERDSKMEEHKAGQEAVEPDDGLSQFKLSMTLQDAKKIIQEYGSVLESESRSGGTAFNASRLSHSPERIVQAMKLWLAHDIQNRSLTQEFRNEIGTAASRLPFFVEDGEARHINAACNDFSPAERGKLSAADFIAKAKVVEEVQEWTTNAHIAGSSLRRELSDFIAAVEQFDPTDSLFWQRVLTL